MRSLCEYNKTGHIKDADSFFHFYTSMQLQTLKFWNTTSLSGFIYFREYTVLRLSAARILGQLNHTTYGHILPRDAKDAIKYGEEKILQIPKLHYDQYDPDRHDFKTYKEAELRSKVKVLVNMNSGDRVKPSTRFLGACRLRRSRRL